MAFLWIDADEYAVQFHVRLEDVLVIQLVYVRNSVANGRASFQVSHLLKALAVD